MPEGSWSSYEDHINYRQCDVLWFTGSAGIDGGEEIRSGRFDVSKYYTKGFIAYTTGSCHDLVFRAYYDSNVVFPTGSLDLESGSLAQHVLSGSSTTTYWKWIEVIIKNSGSSSYDGSKVNCLIFGQN